MKALVVGCGSIGKRHLQYLCGHPLIRHIYVISSVPGCMEGVSAAGKIIELVKDCKSIAPDVAFVCNETHKHIDTALRLARRGIHVFMEKPVSHNLKKTALLARVAAEKRIVVAVGYNLRFLKAFTIIQQQLSSGILGKLYFADIEVGQYLPSWRPNQDYRASYSADTSKGGGVALDLSHEIDYMRLLFGSPVSWKTMKAKVSDLAISSDDIFEGVYGFGTGMLCRVHLDYLQQEKTRTIQIVGSKGVLHCDLVKKAISVTARGKTKKYNDPVLFNIEKTYAAEIDNFLRAVRGNTKVLVSLRDGIEALKLLEDNHV